MSRTTCAPVALAGVLALALYVSVATASAAAKGPVKVFILSGQSNMEGKGKVSLLEYQAAQPETREMFKHLRKDGQWVVRDDVWIKFLDRKGKLTVGFGSPERIGPELEFGHVVGNRYDEQVLLIKTAWGGKSLYRDFRPPSSGLPAAEVLEEILEKQKKKQKKNQPAPTMEDVKASFGAYYRKMLDEISDTLDNLGERFPDYKGQGYEIAGFVWFQGWNDMVNADYVAAYAENMANFIRDVRKDLKAPNLPFVIGQLGVGGEHEEKPNEKKRAFKEAQAAPAQLPEFKGNVAVVKTDALWDMEADALYKKGWKENLEQWQKLGSDRPYHYLGSVKAFTRIGGAFGDAILELSKSKE
jgi:hypothetical protein